MPPNLFSIGRKTIGVLLVATLGRSTPQSTSQNTPYGITPFPYDFTLEAIQKVHETIRPNSTLGVAHLDDGIPWKEMLAGAPLPARIQKDWDDRLKAIPTRRPIYVGLAPLAEDRQSLALATGEQERVPMPAELNGAELDDPKVENAYTAYALLAVKQFHPAYLNIGIEAGEIMSRNFAKWPRFEALYHFVKIRVKAAYPEVKIGISFGLGELRAPKEAEAAKPLIADSDYVGLSFYPYASGFDEKFGAPPYGGENPWRQPLAWIRSYTTKPIAICETGFSSQNVDLPQFDLHLKGSPEAQANYVRELIQTARKDNYAFVVWFLAVDYDKLFAKMPPGSDSMKLWMNTGFFDSNLNPKPAWAAWQSGVR